MIHLEKQKGYKWLDTRINQAYIEVYCNEYELQFFVKVVAK